jgi:hypothetical protein
MHGIPTSSQREPYGGNVRRKNPGGAFQKRITIVVLLLVSVLVVGRTLASAAVMPAVASLSQVNEGLSAPIRLAAGAGGIFFVSDPRGGGVLKFSGSGKLLQIFYTSRLAQGVAVDSKGNILVGQGDYVSVLDPVTGSETGRLGQGAGQFKFANGIALDTTGFVYVVDSLANCVQVFNAAGTYQYRFGTAGTLGGQLSMPTGITYESAGTRLAVADTLNGRIQFFSPKGAYLSSIGSSGSGPLLFTTPQAVAFEYTKTATPALSRMYVVDSYQSTVQVIDPMGSGTFLGFIGSYGTSNGHLMVPTDALFDSQNGRLLVVNGVGNLTSFGIDGGTNPIDTTLPTQVLTVVAGGSGSGTVTSVPAGIACSGGTCNAAFVSGTQVTLLPTADANSVFAGWSGACSGTGNCTVTLNGPVSVTATFTGVPPVKVDGPTPTYFPTIQAAYDATPAGSSVTILTRAAGFTENVVFDRNVNVIIHGGYDNSFLNVIGRSTLQGSLTLGLGTLVSDNLTD